MKYENVFMKRENVSCFGELAKKRVINDIESKTIY